MMNEIRSKNAPYVRLDVSIRPFVRALLRFIEHTDTHDLAMVLRNEKEQYEGIYELLNQYSIRSITYPGLSESISERILDLRPVPNNYGMVSGTEDMNVLFNKVIQLHKPINQSHELLFRQSNMEYLSIRIAGDSSTQILLTEVMPFDALKCSMTAKVFCHRKKCAAFSWEPMIIAIAILTRM